VSDPAPRPGLVIGALLAVQFLFGLQYVVIKIALDEGLDPLEWAAVRAVCATVLLVATARAFRCPFPTDRDTVWRLAGCAVLGMVINQVCFVIGLAYTTPGQSALINVSIPVTALVFAWILRTERPDLARSIGVAAAAGGLTLMLSGGLQDDWRTGNWFTFANALSFGLFLVVSRGVYRRIHPYAGTAVLFVFGTIGICAIAAAGWLAGWWTPDTPWTTLSASAWAAMIYTVLGATVGTYALNAFALRRADSSIVGFFIFLQPLIATTLSWLRGGEQPGWRFWVAAALVGVGVFVVLGRARMLRVRARSAAAADVLPGN
jgi:drug/metabolite transporter (DMT)-like permease